MESASALHELLSQGWVKIHPAYWDHIPIGAEICYTIDGAGPAFARYCAGGIVKKFVETDGERQFMIDDNVVSYNSIDMLWKRYPRQSAIELHSVRNSIARLNAQVIAQEKRIEFLERAILMLVKQENTNTISC